MEKGRIYKNGERGYRVLRSQRASEAKVVLLEVENPNPSLQQEAYTVVRGSWTLFAFKNQRKQPNKKSCKRLYRGNGLSPWHPGRREKLLL